MGSSNRILCSHWEERGEALSAHRQGLHGTPGPEPTCGRQGTRSPVSSGGTCKRLKTFQASLLTW